MKRTESRLVVVQKCLLQVSAMVLVAMAVACSGTSQQPTNPAGPAVFPGAGIVSATTPDPAAEGSVARQVAGTLNGRFDFTHMWGSEWWQFYSDGDASGPVSHLGLTRIRTRHIPNLNTGALEQGTFTIIAANGDEVHGTYEGSAAYDPDRADLAHGTATFVVSGGTGRFTGTTGSITATFLETFDDPSWASAKVTWTLAGTLKY